MAWIKDTEQTKTVAVSAPLEGAGVITEFTLNPNKSSYLPGERLVATAVVTNKGQGRDTIGLIVAFTDNQGNVLGGDSHFVSDLAVNNGFGLDVPFVIDANSPPGDIHIFAVPFHWVDDGTSPQPPEAF